MVTSKGYYWGYECFYRPTPSLPYLKQPQSIQTIWSPTAKHHSQHKWRGEGHGIVKWKGVTETLSGRLIPLDCSTNKLSFFLAILHCLALCRQTPVWLGRSSKNMYTDEPESWNHFAIDSLNRSLLVQSAAIIVSFLKKWCSWLMTIFSLCSIQSVSSFWHHLHCG